MHEHLDRAVQVTLHDKIGWITREPALGRATPDMLCSRSGGLQITQTARGYRSVRMIMEAKVLLPSEPNVRALLDLG